jgi:hypothetical protein
MVTALKPRRGQRADDFEISLAMFRVDPGKFRSLESDQPT